MKPGERIRQFRSNKGLNQTEFGQKIEYSQKFVSDIEIGKVEPSREFLKKLNEVFGISTDYILYGNPPDETGIELVVSPEQYIQGYKKSMFIHEPEGEYQILPNATKKIIDNTVEILESGNEVIIDILKANIKVFLEAVRTGKKSDENKGGKIR